MFYERLLFHWTVKFFLKQLVVGGLCSAFVRPLLMLNCVCNAANEKLLRAVICAGLYPNVAKLSPLHKPNRYQCFDALSLCAFCSHGKGGSRTESCWVMETSGITKQHCVTMT